LRLAGSEHNSFNDFQVLLPQTADELNVAPEVVRQAIGTDLLRHPSRQFPEMQFMP
jgi:hypothetical protein